MLTFNLKQFTLAINLSYSNISSCTEVLKGALSRRFCYIFVKMAQIFDKNLFSNMKLLLEHREGNIKGFIWGRTNYKQFLTTSLQYTGGT